MKWKKIEYSERYKDFVSFRFELFVSYWNRLYYWTRIIVTQNMEDKIGRKHHVETYKGCGTLLSESRLPVLTIELC